MSNKKKDIRNNFRNAVFERDNYKCKVCDLSGVQLDAHHITDRNLMPNGGYVPENGISLCPDCHNKAEDFHRNVVPLLGFSPDELYQLIGSSIGLALEQSKRIGK